VSDVVLTVEGLSIELEGSGVDIADEVAFTIRGGEILGLVGESGSGKTTVATALLMFERHGAVLGGGRITIDGRDVFAGGLSPTCRKTRRCR
jgi:peptide/nickel transport system ATP-binding protein